MRRFDRQKLAERIYEIAKAKDISIGSLEKSVGVSAGYFSRLLKGDGKSSFSLETLILVADVLGVSYCSLITASIIGDESESDSEVELQRFFDSLTRDTKDSTISWKSLSYLNENSNIGLGQPLLIETASGVNSKDDGIDGMLYLSSFETVGSAYISGDCFSATIDTETNTDIYIMNVGIKAKTGSIANYSHEIYFVSNDSKVEPLISTAYVSSMLRDSVSVLYETIKEKKTIPMIDKYARTIIHSYMERRKADE